MKKKATLPGYQIRMLITVVIALIGLLLIVTGVVSNLIFGSHQWLANSLVVLEGVIFLNLGILLLPLVDSLI